MEASPKCTAMKPTRLPNNSCRDKSNSGKEDTCFLASFGGERAVFVGNDSKTRKRYIHDPSGRQRAIDRKYPDRLVQLESALLRAAPVLERHHANQKEHDNS